MPLFELGFGPGAGGLGIAEYSVAKRDSFGLVDLRVGFGNDTWTVTAFGTNITDESYLEEVIPAPEFGGSFAHDSIGRTYGLDLTYRF